MTAATAPIIDVRDLAVEIDGRPVLWDISFSIAPGNFFGIIGPRFRAICDNSQSATIL